MASGRTASGRNGERAKGRRGERAYQRGAILRVGRLGSMRWRAMNASARRANSLVPEGLNDGSKAIYCLECVEKEIRPVGKGMIWCR